MCGGEYIPDYNDLHALYEAEQDRKEKKLPICDCCGERITDDCLYDIEGTIYCEDCLNDEFKKFADSYLD